MYSQLVLLSIVMTIMIVLIAPKLTYMVISIIKFAGLLYTLFIGIVIFRNDSLTGEEATVFAVNNLVLALAYGALFCLCLVLLKHCVELLQDRFSWLQMLHRDRIWQNDITLREPKAPALKPRTQTVTAYAPGYPAISLLSDNRFVIRLAGCIDEKLARQFRKQCELAKDVKRYDHIRIEINSPGGQYDSHFEIRRAVQELAQYKYVEILVTGGCQSAAVTILTCVPVERRLSMTHSNYVMHAGSNGAGIDNESLRLSNERLIETIVDETNIEEGSLRRLFKSRRDFTFSPETALQLGVIGHIVPDVTVNS